MHKLYIIQFRQLFFKEEGDGRVIFVPNFEDARIFTLADFNDARKIAQRIGGTVRGFHIEFD